MVWYWDPTTILNLVLSVVILMIGCRSYAKTKKKTPFFIGVAFGLFSISHLITLMGMEVTFETTIMLVRIFAYIIVALALLRMPKEHIEG